MADRATPFIDRRWLIIALLIFGVSRALSVWSPVIPAASDVAIYARYVNERQQADRAGLTLHEYHCRLRPGTEYENVEYPPLSLGFLELAALGLDRSGMMNRPMPAGCGCTTFSSAC